MVSRQGQPVLLKMDMTCVYIILGLDQVHLCCWQRILGLHRLLSTCRSLVLAALQALFKPFLIGVSVRFISGYDLTLCQILESLTMNESVNYSPKHLRAGVKLVRVWFNYPCWGHYQCGDDLLLGDCRPSWRWLCFVLNIRCISVSGIALCGGNKDDCVLSFLIVLSYRMLEDKHCLSVGIFDRLHFRHN